MFAFYAAARGNLPGRIGVSAAAFVLGERKRGGRQTRGSKRKRVIFHDLRPRENRASAAHVQLTHKQECARDFR